MTGSRLKVQTDLLELQLLNEAGTSRGMIEVHRTKAVKLRVKLGDTGT